MNRWAWANRGPQDRNAEATEGLNELGEAPPPYDGAKRGSNAIHEYGQAAGPGGQPQPPPPSRQGPAAGWKGDDGEELRTLSPTGIDELGGRSSSAGGPTSATPATATALSRTTSPSPPDYHSIVAATSPALASPFTNPSSATATLAANADTAVTRPSPAALPSQHVSMRR